MKIISAGLGLLVLASAGVAVQAKDTKTEAGPQAAPAKSDVSALKKGLDSIRLASSPPGQGTPPGQANRPVDPDQGDDNASLNAINIVCNKDTPAAQRSAICNRPISP